MVLEVPLSLARKNVVAFNNGQAIHFAFSGNLQFN
jgi:hypothetical protein